MSRKRNKRIALVLAAMLLATNMIPLFQPLTCFISYADEEEDEEEPVTCEGCGEDYYASTARHVNGNIWCSNCKREIDESGTFVEAKSSSTTASTTYETEITNSPIRSDVKESASDLYTSATLNSSNAYPRVTEVYSLNNKEAECYYRPTSDRVNHLGARISKLGNFAAVYTGYYDINNSAVSKPPSGATRALEILGYDYILQDEYYDTASKSYVAVKLDSAISRTTAVMDLYKSLGVELQDIYMYHTVADFSQNNSPAANMIGYNATKINGFYTFVFVTRTNPKLYLRKFAQDFNITDIEDDTTAITYAEFMVLTTKMMQMYGEPVMSEQEQLLLIQAYGAEAPVGVSTELLEAWMYLKARGVLNTTILDYNAPVSKTDFFDILMCVKDENSRTNFKEIQLTYELNTELVNQGYYANDMTVVLSDSAIIESEAVYSECTVFDYYIPISKYSTFIAVSGAELLDMYVSATSELSKNDKTAIPSSRYVGKDSGYYHYQIPIEEYEGAMTSDGYYVIDTSDESDYPTHIYVEAGGGIYTPNTIAGSDSSMKFDRRRFLSQEFTDAVDYERYNGIEYETEVGEESTEVDGGDDGKSSSKETSTDDLHTITLEDWEGAPLDVVPVAYQNSPGWVKIESNGGWRYLYKSSSDTTYCQGGFYKIVSKAKDKALAEGVYYFDNDGYAVSGWLEYDSVWYYLNPTDYTMLYTTTVTINGVSYTFDQYGRMFDEDSADYEWSGLTSVAGQWQYDQAAGKWWYLVDDGSVLYDDVCMITNKLYYFDDDGYMCTGFIDIFDNGQVYYFGSDGAMYQNKTTPDGYYVDSNGRVQASYTSILSNNKIFKAWLSRIRDGFCMTAYAASNVYYPDSSWMDSIYGSNGKLYRITIYYALYNESKEEIDTLVTTLQATNVTKSSTYTSFTTPISAQYISSLLSYASNPTDLTLVTGTNGLANFSESESLLVSFTSLVEAGLFSPNVGTDGNSTIVLNGIQESSGSSGSQYNSSRSGFGQIYINNKDKTIKVGSTIYKLSNGITLWTTMDADALDETPQYLDSTTGTLKNVTGNQLYIDVRAVFGWAGNEFTFAITKDDNDTGDGKKVILSPTATKNSGYNITYREAKAPFNVTGTTVSHGKYRVRVLTGYGSNNENMIVMTNMYAIANFAIIRSYKSANNQESAYIVTYWPDELLAEYGITLPANNTQTLANSIGFAPSITGYTPRVASLGGISSVTPGNDVEVGKFYYDSNYGLLYCAPTPNAFGTNAKEAGNGYEKLVKGEYLCPLIISGNGYVYDMSMPYLPGTPFGSEILPYSGVGKLDDLYPMIGGLSYFLWREQTTAGVSLDSVVANTKSDDYFYFGQLRLLKESNTKVKVDGLKTSGSAAISLSVSSSSPINFVNVDVFTTTKSSGDPVEHKVYVTAPEAITYVAADASVSSSTSVSWGTGGESNIFSNWADYKLQDWINAIEDGKNLLLMFAIYVIPLVGFTLAMIVFGFSLLSDFKLVQKICTKYLDPVKILSLGAKDIYTCGGIKYYVCVLAVVTSFALAHGGNILKILRWFIYWFAETMNIINRF